MLRSLFSCLFICFVVSILAACTPKLHRIDTTASQPVPISGGGKTPGIIHDSQKIRSRYGLTRLTIEAPPGSVVPLNTSLQNIRVVLFTASVEELIVAAHSKPGEYVKVSNSEVLGSIVPKPDGSFEGDFPKPTLEREVLAMTLTNQSSEPLVFVPTDNSLVTAAAQFIPSNNMVLSFANLSELLGTRTTTSFSTQVSQTNLALQIPWVNPGCVDGIGGCTASVSLPYRNQLPAVSQSLVMKGFFSSPDSSLPLASIVNGIEVSCYWRVTDPYSLRAAKVSSIRFIKGDGVNSNEKANPLYEIPHSWSESPKFGGQDDTWGLDLIASEINDPNFALRLTIADGSVSNQGTLDVEIDYCKLDVYYTTYEVIAKPRNGSQMSVFFLGATSQSKEVTLERQSPGGSWKTVGELSQNPSELIDMGLSNLTEYSYRIRKTNPWGQVQYSSTFTRTTHWSGASYGNSFDQSLNNNLWNIYGEASSVSGTLNLLVPPVSVGVITAGVISKFSMYGDFDVSVDYSNLNFTFCGSHTSFGILMWGDNGAHYGLARTTDPYSSNQIQYHDDTFYGWGGNVNDSSTSGSLRIKRVGTSYTGYRGSAVVYTWTGTSGPLMVGLYGQSSAACSSTISFDNFRIQ